MTWDPDGNIYISDGYVNSRVAKFDKDGDWVKSWGERGKGPGEFNLLHTIAADAQGNIYVGDRNNRRIQVFDTDGNFKREFTIDVPFDRRRQAGDRQHARPDQLSADRRQLSAGRAVGDLHHARTEPGAVHRPTPFPAASTSSRSTARCSAGSASRASSSSSSAGSTRSRARPRMSSTSPRF